MKIILLFFISMLLISCSTTKKENRSLANFEYDTQEIVRLTFSKKQCLSKFAYNPTITQQLNTDSQGKVISNVQYYTNVDDNLTYSQASLGDSYVFIENNRSKFIECVDAESVALNEYNCNERLGYNPKLTQERNESSSFQEHVYTDVRNISDSYILYPLDERDEKNRYFKSRVRGSIFKCPKSSQTISPPKPTYDSHKHK